MGVNRMTGTPWHAEQVHRAEDDARRYKGRCKHYSYEGNRCSYNYGTCIGSAHCNYYVAITEEEFKKRQKARDAKNHKKVDDDVYWF